MGLLDLTQQLFGPGSAGGQEGNFFENLATNPSIQFGINLMAASGNHPVGGPSNMGQRLAQAGRATSQGQNEALRNDFLRSRITENKAEADNLAAFTQYLQDNPGALGELGPMAGFFPKESVKAMIAARLDPNAKITGELRGVQLQQAEANLASGNFDLAEEKKGARRVYTAFATGVAALERGTQIPGFESLLINEGLRKALRQGSANSLLKGGTDLVALYGLGISKADLPDALVALELIDKAMKQVGGSTQNAVAAQRIAMEALAGGSGLDATLTVFRQELGAMKKFYGDTGWKIPDTPASYPFDRASPPTQQAQGGGRGFQQPGGLQPQPAGVYGKLPGAGNNLIAGATKRVPPNIPSQSLSQWPPIQLQTGGLTVANAAQPAVTPLPAPARRRAVQGPEPSKVTTQRMVNIPQSETPVPHYSSIQAFDAARKANLIPSKGFAVVVMNGKPTIVQLD